MTKRLKIQCWNCPRVYSLSLEIADQKEIIVSCPYCKVESIVDLRPYPDTTEVVYRDSGNAEKPLDEENILPAQKR